LASSKSCFASAAFESYRGGFASASNFAFRAIFTSFSARFTYG
jgi:hypothetical protein